MQAPGQRCRADETTAAVTAVDRLWDSTVRVGDAHFTARTTRRATTELFPAGDVAQLDASSAQAELAAGTGWVANIWDALEVLIAGVTLLDARTVTLSTTAITGAAR